MNNFLYNSAAAENFTERDSSLEQSFLYILTFSYKTAHSLVKTILRSRYSRSYTLHFELFGKLTVDFLLMTTDFFATGVPLAIKEFEALRAEACLKSAFLKG